MRRVLERIIRPSFTVDEFFSVNRFLYDALIEIEKPTLSYVSTKLCLSPSQLKNRLFNFRLPTSMRELKQMAIQTTVNNDPPPIYKIIKSGDIALNFHRAIELLKPIKKLHSSG